MNVRSATLADADSIASLLEELGYPSSAADVSRRLATMIAVDGQSTLVAGGADGIVGLANVQRLPVLHSNLPVAQLMLIVVAQRARRRGIGRILVAASERWAVEQGCTRMLVTSGEERAEAHAFYEAIGYHHYARRFSKRIGS